MVLECQVLWSKGEHKRNPLYETLNEDNIRTIPLDSTHKPGSIHVDKQVDEFVEDPVQLILFIHEQTYTFFVLFW